MREEDLFRDIIDPEDAVAPIEIDVEQIGKESKDYVCSMVKNLSKFYYDEAFMNSHPVFKKRVDSDIDSLCILIKMRSVDEVTQDSILKAISSNSGNASLYRALTDIQRTILNIQSKIEETIRSLELFMKGYQMSIQFEPENKQDSSGDSDDDVYEMTTRGTKDFILQMKEGEA